MRTHEGRGITSVQDPLHLSLGQIKTTLDMPETIRAATLAFEVLRQLALGPGIKEGDGLFGLEVTQGNEGQRRDVENGIGLAAVIDIVQEFVLEMSIEIDLHRPPGALLFDLPLGAFKNH